MEVLEVYWNYKKKYSLYSFMRVQSFSLFMFFLILIAVVEIFLIELIFLNIFRI